MLHPKHEGKSLRKLENSQARKDMKSQANPQTQPLATLILDLILHNGHS